MNDAQKQEFDGEPGTRAESVTVMRLHEGDTTKGFTIHGKTFKVKDTLYREGFTYSTENKVWTIQTSESASFPALLFAAERKHLKVFAKKKEAKQMMHSPLSEKETEQHK